MAGSSMTFAQDTRGCLRRLICTFTSDDAAGTASGTTAKICGRFLKVVTDPGAGGVAPTDNWDVVVTDENGLSPFAVCQNAAALLTRDTANTEETYLYLVNTDGTASGIASYPVVCGVLTVAVANAGNSKTGTITFYYENLE